MSADQPRPVPSGLAVDDGLQFDPSLEKLSPPEATDSRVHPHPPPLTLAYMADLASKKDTKDELKKLQKNGHLVGWMVLVTAMNTGLNNDYHGVAFFHPKARQLVFSHRNTQPSLTKPGSLLTDIFGVTLNLDWSHLLSAMTFVHQVLSKMEGHVESLFITGHSLGGWLSGATTYSAQHLTVINKKFSYRKYPRWKPHTTTFESPGAFSVILELKKMCQPTQDPFSMDQLDMTDYVSSPNFINTAKSHCGSRLLQIDNKPTTGNLTKLMNLGKNVKTEHGIQSMIDCFDEQSGFPESSQTLQEVMDWPANRSERKEADRQAGAQNMSEPNQEEIAKVRLQATEGKMTERQLACFTLAEKAFLHTYETLPDKLKLISLPLNGLLDPVTVLTKFSFVQKKRKDIKLTDASSSTDDSLFVAPIKFQCPTPSDVLLLVPTVRRLIRHHPLYIYELLAQKNLNKYLTRYLDVKFEAISKFPVTDGCVIHVEAPDDPLLTAKRVLHTLQQQQPERQPIVLTHEDLAAVHNDPMLAALRGIAERFVFILIKDVADSVQTYQHQIEALQEAGVMTVVVTRQGGECLGNKVTTERVNWNDLTPDSRVGLLGRKAVGFQGSSELVSLRDIIPSLQVNDAITLDKMVLAELITKTSVTPADVDRGLRDLYRRLLKKGAPSLNTTVGVEVLGKLLSNASVDVGRSLPALPRYYVPRTITLYQVNRKIFQSHDFCFLITGISNEDFQLLPISRSFRSDFHFLPKRTHVAAWPTERGTALCLRHQNGKFYLWDSDGDTNRALQWVEDSFQFQEDDLRVVGMPAVCIVGGEPGVGKSTALKNMAKGLKQDSPMSWVIHVDLHDHTELFERHTPDKNEVFSTKESVIGFVVNDLLGCKGIEQSGLQESLEKGECRLVVDSFDEIAPKYKDFVLRLLTALKKFGVCRHLVVATRNHLLSDLQKKLGGCSMTVAKFTEEQKDLFIEGKCKSENQSEEKVKELLRRLPASERLSDLWCNPLQLAMLTDVLASAESHKWAKLGDLYRGFVKKKEDIWKEKEDWTKDPTALIDDMLQNVATFHVSHALQSLFPGAEAVTAKPVDESVVKYALKMGIVEQRGDTIRFIHQTFAEYFVAEFLLKLLEAPTITLEHQHWLLNEILVKKEHSMIRRFLNDLLSGHENVPKATKGGVKRRANGNGQWVLHVVADENHVDLGRYLQTYFSETHKDQWNRELLTGDGDGDTPVHCAVKRGAFKLLNVWQVTGSNGCLTSQNTFGLTPVELTMITLLSDDTERSARGTWLGLIQDTIDWTGKDSYGRTIVHRAAQRGNFTLLLQLYNTLPQCHESLVICDKDGNTPVNLAVETLVSNDAEGNARGAWLGLIRGIIDLKSKGRYAGRVNWTDLTPDGRVGLLAHKTVRFQGSSDLVSLSDIFPSLQVNDAKTLDKMVGPEVLAELITKTSVTPADVGRSIPPVPDCYVPRRFQLLKVDRRIFAWDDCCFAITGISPDAFQTLLISVSSNSELKFTQKFTHMLDTKRTTLYLRCEEGIFYLWYYHGDVTCILRDLDKPVHLADSHGAKTHALKVMGQDEEQIYKIIQAAEDSFQFHEGVLANIGMPSVCIVGGEPGLGKSLMLKSLTRGLKQDSPMLWVIHVDLHNHTKLFERNTPDKKEVFNTKESVIGFVVNDLLGCKGIEQFGVRESLEKRECCLVVDSFDEIAPRYKDFVLRLLKALKEFGVCRHLVVATRNHLLSDLQKELGGCSMTVAKFTEEQKDLFIEGKCKEGGKSKEMMKALLRRLPASERLSDLSCNPLQLAMLTDVLSSAESGDWAKLSDLYRGFVREKEAIWKAKEGWTKDPTGMIYDILQNVTSLHTSQALQSLCPGAGVPTIDKSVVNYALKMGIVEQHGDTIRFIHQTFAEYFVAQYILTVLQQPTITPDQQDWLINEILVKEEHAMIRVFLNDLLAGHENVPIAEEGELERRANRDGQWVLHVVADENHVDLGRYLQKYFRENPK